jgi:NAD(P)-dependent dehydrogenase (short-subunit alcohol dehydrogenase family)
MRLKDHSVIITGANRGFGLAVAKVFVQEGANVAICGRDEHALTLAKEELQRLANDQSNVIAQPLDILDMRAIEQFIQVSIATFGKVTTFIANAGVYGTKGAIETIDWDEWSTSIDINLKGTVLCCRGILPHLKQQRYGKIIILSGGGATKPMPFLSAYAASKAAVVRFAETLAEEVKDYHIDVNTIAPGALNTRLLEEILAAGPEKVGQAFYSQSLKQKETGGTSMQKGADLCVYLASSSSDGLTGKLISAVWDPWEKFDKYKAELMDSDIYTLRRIVPEDREKQL